ncbi:MAG: hypothetical protein GWN07_20515, partial [Actinobacteria bacterium]|nr:hypothetical protein [Actinomycetota bacterium]
PGATVASDGDPAASATSFATPDDPNLGDGFYWMFSSLTGQQSFTATAENYVGDTQSVDVAPSATNEANFGLGAGLLTVTPGEVEAEMRLGDSATRTFTVTNEGTAAAQVELSESDGGFEMLGVDDPRVGATPQLPDAVTDVPGVAGAPSGTGEQGLAGSGLAPGTVVTPTMPAAAPNQTTITHSESQDIMSGNSVACSPDGGFSTTENGYLRTFVLDDFGIGG